jgi:radical SAM superfamily enzyme YgiQ (UPF0313 family)
LEWPFVRSLSHTVISIARTEVARRVCLVRPPALTSIHATDGNDAVAPLGLAYLAGSLKEAGHQVQGVDAVGEAVARYSVIPDSPRVLLHGLPNAETVALIDPETEVFGVSCMFSTEWIVAKSLIEAIRAAFPNALIVVGGEHVTAVPEYTLTSCPAVDVAVLGEGEETFVDLVDAHTRGRDFAEVAGIAHRVDGELVRNERRERVRAIDSIPEPDWEKFPVTNYIEAAMTHGANLGRSIPILASRGCPYECTFCSSPFMWTTRWIARKPELVIAEMQKYMRDYDVTNFDFEDLTAIVDRKWILEFARQLKDADMNITWQLPSGTRSEAIDFEVGQALYSSGCRIITYSPESGSPDELKRIKKKIKLPRMIQSMEDTLRAGMDVKCNFIFGLPGGSWKDVFNTMKFGVRLAWMGVDASFFAYSPYPGATLFHELLEEGKVSLTDEYFKKMHISTDVGNTQSYADYISPRQLRLVVIFTYLLFYGSRTLFHPIKGSKLIWKMLRNDTSTKITMALAQKRHKKRIAEATLASESGTATVPAFTGPTKVAPRADRGGVQV